MSPEEHALSLGKIVSNFHSLETLLRLALFKQSPSQDLAAHFDFDTVQVGTKLSTNEFTDYSDLRTLIVCFNRNQRNSGRREVDVSLVELRDAIAHGRILAKESRYPIRLFKFSKPDRYTGQVTVAFNEVLSRQWFTTQLVRTHAAIQFVASDT